MKKYLRGLVYSATLLVTAHFSYGQPPSGRGPVITVKTTGIAFSENQHDLQQNIRSQNGGLYYIVSQNEENISSLEKDGIRVENVMNQDVLLVYLSPSSKTGKVSMWSEVPSMEKVNHRLLPYYTSGENTSLDILLSFPKHFSEAEIVQLLSALNISPSNVQPWKSQNIWEVSLPASELAPIAHHPQVKYINPLLEDQAVNNRSIALSNASPAHQPLATGGYNLKGSGVTIGVGDDSNPQSHIDFNGRISFFNPMLNSSHGFHTTGTAAGAGLRSEKYTGFAPKANIISQFFSGVVAYANDLYDGYDMRITNNSYGNILGDCDYAGTYDIYSQFLDEQIRERPQLLHVFAAANDGSLTCNPYPQGFHTVAGSYQAAKNVLVVGNATGDYTTVINDFSSRGPVKDGRLKPEIIALGTNVFSTVLNNSYAINGGTSMACPAVSGAAVLLYEYYKDQHAGQNPESALIKLLLMNGATDVLNPGPDFKTGFGIMNLGHSLKALNNNQYFSGIANPASNETFTFSVPANMAKVRVMLYWDDPASAPEPAQALINDLDLSVVTPSATTMLPLILNTASDQMDAVATPGADHLNNVEQVTINNPPAGTYTIQVGGLNVPVADQKFYVSYDFIPSGIAMQYPFGGEMMWAGDTLMLYWEASDGINPFAVDYSIDNGASWASINNAVDASLRNVLWPIPANIASANCRIRVRRNNMSEQSISGAFTVLGRPVVTIAPTTEQCPGSVKFNWTAVPGVDGYKVFLLEGSEMTEKATVPSSVNSYTFSGLDMSSAQWVTVAPVLNGNRGLRSVAVSRVPASGVCSGYTTNDLSITNVLTPSSGRELTSSALSSSEPMTVHVYNLSGTNPGSYRISYRINSGNWVNQDFDDAILPGNFLDIALIDNPLNLSTPGDYNISVAVTNLSAMDQFHNNDTFHVLIRNVANEPLDVTDDGYEDGFENVSGLNQMANEFGIAGAHHWDFSPSKSKGRIRSFVMNDVTINGVKSISLDNNFNQKGAIAQSSLNTLTGTFNMSNYSPVGIELRFDFDYRMHGVPKFLDTGNRVWVRGSDTSSWIAAHVFDTTEVGTVHNTGSLSFNDLLIANNQQFSTSTQIKIEQYDTSLICGPDFGNGLTMDNFKIYLVTNDVQMLAINAITSQNCAMSASTPLSVKVRNGVFYDLSDIPVFYQLDDQSIIADTIPFIAAKDTVDFVFSIPMNVSETGAHNLSVWVALPVDSYHANDSIVHYLFVNQPTITGFPYLEDFENDNGNYYMSSDSTWEHGSPQSNNIKYAASGNKAWKTNLDGHYKPGTTSYLYSPCFDIGTMTIPMLSFSLAYDIEPKDQQLYDQAYVEYSNDGATWSRLGTEGEGTNWYNDDADVWEGQRSYWHVATASIPTTHNIVMFRFVVKSDPGTEMDGMAIDDVHIYDLVNPIYASNTDGISSQNVAAASTVSFLSGGEIMGRVQNAGNALGNVELKDYAHDSFVNTDSMQYFLPRSFTIQPATAGSANAVVRLYVTDDDMQRIRDDENCVSCSKVKEVYRLGVSQYSNANKELENDRISDNEGGSWKYIPYSNVRWVPYDRGYYAAFPVSSFSEFWFNDGGAGGDKGLHEKSLDFIASHLGPRYVQLDWTCYSDPSIQLYTVERSENNIDFEPIGTFEALQQNDSQSYIMLDSPKVNTSSAYYYRLYYRSAADSTLWYYSLTRRLEWTGAPDVFIYPNPTDNIINITWIKDDDTPLRWALFNISGQQLAEGTLEQDTNEGFYQLQLDRLGISAGILLLKIKSGGQNWAFKIAYKK